jgi:hypothetical protein
MNRRILSLGAGVQSSTLALMAARGEIPAPDAAIFADTGYEPQRVYAWLDWLETQLPFPVLKVSNGNLRADTLAGTTGDKKRFASIPFFSEGGGISRRQCTMEYKLTPIQRKCREMGATAKSPVEMWVGISLDEIFRVKPSRVKYLVSRWPLIERRMTRADCLAWMHKNGYPEPPKSSCIGCPFHSDALWRDMKLSAPSEFEDACEFDERIREGGTNHRERQFIHRSLRPLREVDFRSAEDAGQINLFVNECEGLCGV